MRGPAMPIGKGRTAPRWHFASVFLIQAFAAGAAWPIQTTVAGRAVDLDGTFSLREVIEENGSTKHELTREQLRLRFGVSLTDWLRFDSHTVATNGGPTMRARDGGIYAWDEVFQDVSPAVEFAEAYLALKLPAFDLRIGKQKVAWGKLDSNAPNDLINPLSYVDPFLEDEIDRKIGVPAIQASYYLPDSGMLPSESRLTAVWIPRYLPYRFPSAGCEVEANTSRCDVERWFPPAGVPPTAFTVPAGLVNLPDGAPSPSFTVPVGFRVHDSPLPAWDLSNSEIALRFSALIRDVDVDVYYFHGFDSQPAFDLTANLSAVPDMSSPLGLSGLAADTVLSPKFFPIDAWGADFAYAFERFTVRGEGAFISGRPFARDLRRLVDDPRELAPEIRSALAELTQGAGTASVALPSAAVVHSAVEWGIGVDYVLDGYTALIELHQTDVLHNQTDLLIEDVETRLVANLRKSFLADRLKTQLLGVHAIESDYSLLRASILCQLTDAVSAQVGYLFLAGRAASVIGQYRRNDQGFLRLEYRL